VQGPFKYSDAILTGPCLSVIRPWIRLTGMVTVRPKFLSPNLISGFSHCTLLALLSPFNASPPSQASRAYHPA